jgi:hypothetical protein
LPKAPPTNGSLFSSDDMAAPVAALRVHTWPLCCRDPLFEGHVACEPELPAVICTWNCREIEYSKMLL